MLNEGKIDRVARVLLGVALIALVFVGPKTWLGWFGLIPLATGVVGICPLYRWLGIKTTKPVSREPGVMYERPSRMGRGLR